MVHRNDVYNSDGPWQTVTPEFRRREPNPDGPLCEVCTLRPGTNAIRACGDCPPLLTCSRCLAVASGARPPDMTDADWQARAIIHQFVMEGHHA